MEIKPGIKSTEFWTAAIGTLAAGLLAAVADHPWVAPVCAVAAVALPTMYIWGRAILKAELARETDLVPDAWEPMLDRVLDLAEALAKALPETGADGD